MFGVADDLLSIKIEFVECLSSMCDDILEERWPSQYRIDAAIGYATVLGLSEAEVDQLHSVLMD